MKTVWRYPINFEAATRTQTISMPIGAEIVRVACKESDPRPHLWVVCDPEAETEERRFHIAATGDAWDGTYLGSFHKESGWMGTLVWHVIELTKDR